MRQEAEWVEFQPGVSDRPECEVVGWDGRHIYAFRCPYAGGLRPGKAREGAFICYGDQEIRMYGGELLKKGNFEWVFAKDGNVPPNAVVAGNDHLNVMKLYIGRVIINGTLTPRFVQPDHHCLYVPYAGKTNRFTSYTVLCYKDVECPKPPPQQPCPKKTYYSSSSGGDYGYGS